MIKVAIMGHGTVGSGVYEVFDMNADKIAKTIGEPVEVKYVLDLRDFSSLPYGNKFVTDFSVIENDPEVTVVAEVMGGVGAAYQFTKRCLEAGKSVCTSNKELVATKGEELLKIAEEHGVNYMFEASVGGGIPVIRPMLQCLAANEFNEICGILNGIDMEANNPATDPKIPFNYDVTNVEEGKAKCKEALQDKFGLHKDGSPVFAMVSRMVGMKGFDLVQSIADGLVDRGIELVILGSGENQYETFFSDLCARHPGRVGTYIGFEPALSQEIYAGADVFIMPSKSEPCGLAQMVACRYGTPPIVRETGGLRDSIHDCTLGEGNGFTFAGYSAHELYDACCRAQDRYYNKEDWNNLVKHDMECDFSWDLSAKSYEGLYNETANLW